MMREPRVYIVQEPPASMNKSTGRQVPKDLSSAQRYGAIRFLLGLNAQASLTPGPSMMEMMRELRDFQPTDYLCFAGGDPMSLALSLIVLRDLGYKDVNVLRWDRERSTDGIRKNGGFYTPVNTPLIVR